MRFAICAVLLVSSTAADPAATEIAGQIASVERRLPWLWSSAAEGLADIPYTYKVVMTRRVATRAGKEVPPAAGTGGLANWRALQLERIPLDWGSHLKCLAEDGRSPCSDEWKQELDRQVKRRDTVTPEERLRFDATREERRQRRRNFWDDFPAALHFESDGANQLRFSPLAGYKPQHTVHNGMLTAIRGRLWFDPATHEVNRLEYDLLRDVDEPFMRLPKGSHFEIALTQSLDQHYLPLRIADRRRIAKAGHIEERTDTFSDFRRFESESKIQFGDPKDREMR